MKLNVRKQVSKSLSDTMNDFFDNNTNDDNFINFFAGIVVDNNDPDKQGKCKIRVYGIFDDNIPDNDLPWALPDFQFIGSTLGSFIVPPVGAIVKVYFQNGDIYFPHYTTKVVVSDKQPSQKNIDYPDNMVFYETDDGDYLTLNRRTKETTFNHNSGTKIIIKENGNVEITVVGNKNETINGSTETDGRGEIKITSDSNITIEAANTLELKGTANLIARGTPAPTGSGPFCLLPNCLFTGAPHQTNKAVGGTP